MTVQGCYDYFTALTDGEEIDESIFLVWVNAINQLGYKTLYNIFPEKYITTKNFNSIVATSSYTFTSISLTDFHSLGGSKCGLYVLTNGVERESLSYTEWGNSTRGFYLGDEKIFLTPVPTAIETFTLRYVKSIASVTGNTSSTILAMTDDLVFPDGFEDLVGEEILVRYWKKEEEPDLMNLSDKFSKVFRERLTGLDEYKPESKTTIKVKFF
jgi:hypothetical protein